MWNWGYVPLGGRFPPILNRGGFPPTPDAWEGCGGTSASFLPIRAANRGGRLTCVFSLRWLLPLEPLALIHSLLVGALLGIPSKLMVLPLVLRLEGDPILIAECVTPCD